MAVKDCQIFQDFQPDLWDTGAGLYRLRWQDNWEMVIKLVYDIPRKNELCQFHILKLHDEEINVRGSSIATTGSWSLNWFMNFIY